MDGAGRGGDELPGGCLSVVMPCHNEAATIERIAARVLASPFTAELIIVDDGSTDATLDLARAITDPRVRVLTQPSNRGKGAALRRGFAEAGSPFVIVQDADLEYNPDDYPLLLAPLVDGRADVVYGNRFESSHAHRVLYFWHALGNRALTVASNMFTNLNLSDMETCYKAFRREVLQSLVLEEDRFGIEPEITAKVARGGWRVYEVGIAYSGRTYAEGKKIGWEDGFRAMYCIVRYSAAVDRVRSRRARPDAVPAASASPEIDAELQATQHALDRTHEHAEWVFQLVAPYLGPDVLEIGAGDGQFTERLAAVSQVTATDVSERNLRSLRRRYDGDGRVAVVEADLFDAASTGTYDAVVLVDVLERVDDDATAVKALAGALKPGGRLVVWVPAVPQLYSDFDRRIGHRRRYAAADLRRLASAAGLEVVDLRYVNLVGGLAWWVVAKRLGRTPASSGLVRLSERGLVPLLRRVESDRRPPFGQSIFLVARRAPGG